VVWPDAARAVVAASNPLAEGARRRRSTFPSAEDALANYASKAPYADLDPEALRLYVQGGFELVPTSEGGDGRAVRLRCRREDEADTFAAAGLHEAFAHLSEVACHVTFCCGEKTDAFGENLMKADAAPVPHARVEVLPSMGHFGPLQAPAAVAASVIGAFYRDEGPGAVTTPS
jgi:pimeloyl-ACP methyl ester carboxylesterase